MKAAERIAIAGGSGAGKTTLGKVLAKLVDGVLVEIDAIQHKPHWNRASHEEIRAGIRAALDGQPRWVIDGICEREVGTFIVSRADLIVWLDLPLAAKLVRLFRRLWRSRTIDLAIASRRPNLHGGRQGQAVPTHMKNYLNGRAPAMRQRRSPQSAVPRNRKPTCARGAETPRARG